MKKSLLRIAGIILLGIAILLVIRFSTPEDTWICQGGQRITHGKPSANMPTEPCAGATTGGTIDLTNCIRYFDGCNTCMVQSGQVVACTKMYCETPSEPKCLEYATGNTKLQAVVTPAQEDCPLRSPPSPEFCPNGTLVDGGKDDKGCQLPPSCQKK